ncbi:rhomboid family intramembrane serine protease [Pedobacter gandavensis]|uniref:Rhomboid family intramembrane serine protease n=1 Tax=Pedobacter gandavensis TaxID=2679963 RepID=A0ABR6EWQ7_9SPHI|nr:rhomboid family intramembrane serine protease [Pedobacter gandavensis]MBB2149664.1 rhomboid family intramembrane serine protease [Pedobacter gandavensis]
MNKSFFEELKYKVFQSGNPVFFYIGINVLIFLIVAFLGIPFFLSGLGSVDFPAFIREYMGYPASIAKLPTRFYTVITYQFFHDGFLHLLFNMLWLFWLGRIFLDFLKPRQFHFVYLAGGIAGAAMYTLAYHLFPVFSETVETATVIGASASVMAVIVATATLVPDYGMRLFLLGDIKLKYLAMAYVAMELVSLASANAGGSFTHIGGALFGFTYITLLQKGKDWSKLFKRKPKLRVVRNEPSKSTTKNKPASVNQQEVDAILDKISKSGYDRLSKEEKETLFKASKH